MTEEQAKALRDMVSKDAAEFIAKCEARKIKNSIVSHGWVVWNPVAGMGMDYDFAPAVNGRREVLKGHVTGITFAPMFTREDAEGLAAVTLCGPDKVPAVAMFINDALDKAIANQKEVLEKISA